MGEGDLRQHVTIRSRDEVQFLGESFNRMSRDLAESHDTIRQQAAQLLELSMRDEMTQLHNRRYFNEQATLAYAQAQRYSRPFAVAIADVDHFKQINDRFSHAAGDAVLREVARLLAAATRETDIVAIRRRRICDCVSGDRARRCDRDVRAHPPDRCQPCVE
jgi:two-component system, cell cycle response regulator